MANSGAAHANADLIQQRVASVQDGAHPSLEIGKGLIAPAVPAVVTGDGADGDRKWLLRPASPIPAGAEVVVRFSYRVDSADAPQFRVTPEGSYAGGGGEIWYPRIGFDSLGTGTLHFVVPAGETVIATGKRLSTAEEQRAGRTAFRVDQPAHFAFASGRYEVVRRPGPIPVNLYLLRQRADAAEIVLRAAQTLQVLGDLFGPLPAREYSIVEVVFAGAVAGTSESGFFLADRAKLDEGFSLPFFGHEIGHAWWGNLIHARPGTVGRMMMSEGFAQYGMLQVLERIEGPAAAERFRRGEYPGYTSSGTPREYFRLAAAGIEVPLTAFEPRGNQTLPMHRMANTRGFLLLDMLARVVGHERFQVLLRRFVLAPGRRRTISCGGRKAEPCAERFVKRTQPTARYCKSSFGVEKNTPFGRSRCMTAPRRLHGPFHFPSIQSWSIPTFECSAGRMRPTPSWRRLPVTLARTGIEGLEIDATRWTSTGKPSTRCLHQTRTVPSSC